MISVCLGLEVFVAVSACGNDDPDSIPSGALDIEAPLAGLDPFDGVLLCDLPRCSIDICSADIGDPLMCSVSVGLIDAPYSMCVGHAGYLSFGSGQV